ncbi:Ulp1 protease family, C-terminal catalytic domain containing protein [Trema orientale]|uniref:Ulp1 protease family, C-terminal catalytic domain containing protein n=1 Tax=Trema orientale TaxID=63057 RepID=A0A2P5FRW8_TREOI|nr:Ulp1 protease family, C-terminal catalytic domain containing protein [Trema orientale]
MKGSRKVQCRCSTEKVCCVISSMTDEQKSVITNCGFGLFLRMKTPFIKSTLISYLIDRIDTEGRTLTIHGNTYSLTKESFEAVMGLLDGEEEIIVYDDMKNNPFRDEIVGADGRIVLSDLVIDLQKSKEADKLFVIRFLLLVIETVLWPTSGVYVNTNYVSLLSDVKRIPKKNWASYTVEFLMNSISGFQRRSSKYMPGYTLYLQLMYLHNVDWHSRYVDRSVPAIAFWSCTNIRRVVRYIHRCGGYESVKLHKAYTILPSVRNTSGTAQPTILPTSPVSSLLNSNGSQCCSCGYKAEVSKLKVEIVDEVRRIMKETVDHFRINITQVVRSEIEVLKDAIVKDFWEAALMRKDPFNNEDDSGEEVDDTEEDSDSGGEEEEKNIGNMCPIVYMKKTEEEAQTSCQNIDVSKCVHIIEEVVPVVEDASMDKGKNENKSTIDPIIVYEKSLKKFIGSRCRTVGEFNLWHPVEENDFEMAEFLFSEKTRTPGMANLLWISVRNTSGTAQPTISPTSPVSSLLNSSGSQCCSCGYRAEEAALMRKDPFNNEDDSGEEVDDTEEDSNSGGEEEGENIGNMGPTVYMKKTKEETQTSCQNIDVSKCVHIIEEVVPVVEDASMDKVKNEKKSTIDPIIVYEKSLKKFIGFRCRTVGEFNLRHPVEENDFEMAEFLFSENQNSSEVLASYGKIELTGMTLKCLKPGNYIDGLLLTYTERARVYPKAPIVWFMPTQVSQEYLGLMMTVNRYAREQQWKERYFSDISVCEHVKERMVEIWDSLSTARDKPKREKKAYKMLETLDTLLSLDRKMAFGDGFRFIDCPIRRVLGIPKQDNGADCGVFVMMYMEALSKGKENCPLFFSVDERLRIALKIIRHLLNTLKDSVTTDVENFILAYRNPQSPHPESANPDVNCKHSTSSSTLVQSPTKSPPNKRFFTKKSRKKNMIPHTTCRSRVAPKI